MPKFDKVLYTAKVHTTGGREGAARSDDGRVDVKFSRPGGSGTGTNPEQLFAAGWSACFLSAIQHVAGLKKIPIPATASIDVEVDLGMAQGNFGLAARLNISLPGIDPETAHQLVESAHQVCPYSRATRGNVDVALKVV